MKKLLITLGLLLTLPVSAAQILIVPQGGTGSSTISANQIILGNGMSAINVVSGLGASGQVLTSNGVGLAPTWQAAGGAGSTTNLQQAYDVMAVDAEILTANNKNLIVKFADTATDANFILSNQGGKGALLFQSASTTMASFDTYGRLGIATSTPGTGLSISTTTDLMSGTVEGTFKVSDLIATSSLAVRGAATSTFGGGVSTAGIASSQGLVVSVGDSIFAGTLKVSSVSTSTFSGGISAVGLASSQGLVISAGDLLSTTGKIQLQGTATSTFAGSINSSGKLQTSKGLDQCYIVTSLAVIDWNKCNNMGISVTADTAITFLNFTAGSTYSLDIFHDHDGSNQLHSDVSLGASTTFYWTGTTTPFTGTRNAGGWDSCTMKVASSTTAGIKIICNYDWNNR